ncbi:MAG: HNH endonuclease [Pseudomonadota bacterium]
MARKEFIYFEFFGANLGTFMHMRGETPEEALGLTPIGEPTEIVVKRKSPHARRHPVTHIHGADKKGYYYAIVEAEHFDRLCQEADARWEKEQADLIAEIERAVPKDRTRAIDDVPEDLKRYIRECDDGCWRWQGRLSTQYYGLLRKGGKNLAAHRVVFERMICPIPKGAILRHACDRSNCVNPAHLTPGTHKQNVDDMVSRERAQWQLEWRRIEKWIAEKLPPPRAYRTDELPERLSSNIEVAESGCWMWRGAISDWGHAMVMSGGREKYAAPFIFNKLVRRTPRGIVFEPTCGDRACVNPAHLTLKSRRPPNPRRS